MRSSVLSKKSRKRTNVSPATKAVAKKYAVEYRERVAVLEELRSETRQLLREAKRDTSAQAAERIAALVTELKRIAMRIAEHRAAAKVARDWATA